MDIVAPISYPITPFRFTLIAKELLIANQEYEYNKWEAINLIQSTHLHDYSPLFFIYSNLAVLTFAKFIVTSPQDLHFPMKNSLTIRVSGSRYQTDPQNFVQFIYNTSFSVKLSTIKLTREVKRSHSRKPFEIGINKDDNSYLRQGNNSVFVWGFNRALAEDLEKYLNVKITYAMDLLQVSKEFINTSIAQVAEKEFKTVQKNKL